MCIRDRSTTHSFWGRYQIPGIETSSKKNIVMEVVQIEYLLIRNHQLLRGFKGREYLAMADLQSWLYLNNCCINLNICFDISMNGHIDEDQSYKDFTNLKMVWLLFSKVTSIGFLLLIHFHYLSYMYKGDRCQILLVAWFTCYRAQRL